MYTLCDGLVGGVTRSGGTRLFLPIQRLYYYILENLPCKRLLARRAMAHALVQSTETDLCVCIFCVLQGRISRTRPSDRDDHQQQLHEQYRHQLNRNRSRTGDNRHSATNRTTVTGPRRLYDDHHHRGGGDHHDGVPRPCCRRTIAVFAKNAIQIHPASGV